MARDALAALAIIVPTLSVVAVLLAAMVAAPLIGFPVALATAGTILMVSLKGVN